MDAGEILGLHHIKVPVTDLDRSRGWYQRVFELEPMLEFPDADGVVRGVAYQPKNGFCLALRENPTVARAMAGFDPFAILLGDQPDVQYWADRLDALGIEHSPIIQATTGWLLAFHDPDGLELLLYTAARHGLDGAGRGRPVQQAPTAR
jgi:catechol 2,3-dioxygenase-like lactoylglutathione lyase family enzyme